ncbi:MAG: hypothetical protein L6R36_004499 [Xanthoria steineri]|nr:MAG: hypothetical protein L6R36_004499 [Xanthoria steineri]
MATSPQWTPRSPASPEIYRTPRCETCCRCLNKTLLTTCGPVCPFCRHGFCPHCSIDTVEEYASKLSNGKNVIVHPTGPSYNCQWLLVDESERRWAFDEQEAQSARRIRLARGDFSPTSIINGQRRIFDTELSSDEVQYSSPIHPRKRAISPTRPPRTIRPKRRTADTVNLTGSPQYSAPKKKKIKAETPDWTMEPRVWEIPDGTSRRISTRRAAG